MKSMTKDLLAAHPELLESVMGLLLGKPADSAAAPEPPEPPCTGTDELAHAIARAVEEHLAAASRGVGAQGRGAAAAALGQRIGHRSASTSSGWLGSLAARGLASRLGRAPSLFALHDLLDLRHRMASDKKIHSKTAMLIDQLVRQGAVAERRDKGRSVTGSLGIFLLGAAATLTARQLVVRWRKGQGEPVIATADDVRRTVHEVLEQIEDERHEGGSTPPAAADTPAES